MSICASLLAICKTSFCINPIVPHMMHVTLSSVLLCIYIYIWESKKITLFFIPVLLWSLFQTRRWPPAVLVWGSASQADFILSSVLFYLSGFFPVSDTLNFDCKPNFFIIFASWSMVTFSDLASTTCCAGVGECIPSRYQNQTGQIDH